jgi:hypothetical protein
MDTGDAFDLSQNSPFELLIENVKVGLQAHEAIEVEGLFATDLETNSRSVPSDSSQQARYWFRPIDERCFPLFFS